MKSSHGATGCRTPHTQVSQCSVRERCVRGELFLDSVWIIYHQRQLGAPPTGTLWKSQIISTRNIMQNNFLCRLNSYSAAGTISAWFCAHTPPTPPQ